MVKSLADYLYTATPGAGVLTRQTHRRVLAATLNADVSNGKVNERWFRDAIAANPALVIEPCKTAEMTDEDWYLWATEHPISDADGNPVGSVDVLLISSSGRVGIVETKLAYNPEKRRGVLAQILDYAVHFPELGLSELPGLPDGVHVSPEEIQERLARVDFLLIIAGDEVDPRVVKLSQAVIGDHMLNQWELALIELALYRGDSDYVIIPTLRNMVATETRNVVRVHIPTDGGKPQVKLERIAPEPSRQRGRRPPWSEREFFEKLNEVDLSQSFKSMANSIRALANRDNSRLTLSGGTGETGSMTLKRESQGLVELYLDGTLRFRPGKFEGALGPRAADYLTDLRRLFPEPMKADYPLIRAPQAAAGAAELTSIIERVVTETDVAR
jgi:hypothetical protein